ncbi:MAG TPA: hypothetical protein VGR47_19090 [Terracidiphilus sp.]|nr:hypothetical protein [Terracidiphilus sp.]
MLDSVGCGHAFRSMWAAIPFHVGTDYGDVGTDYGDVGSDSADVGSC